MLTTPQGSRCPVEVSIRPLSSFGGGAHHEVEEEFLLILLFHRHGWIPGTCGRILGICATRTTLLVSCTLLKLSSWASPTEAGNAEAAAARRAVSHTRGRALQAEPSRSRKVQLPRWRLKGTSGTHPLQSSEVQPRAPENLVPGKLHALEEPAGCLSSNQRKSSLHLPITQK